MEKKKICSESWEEEMLLSLHAALEDWLKERFYAFLNRVGHYMLCVLGQVPFVKRMFDV